MSGRRSPFAHAAALALALAPAPARAFELWPDSPPAADARALPYVVAFAAPDAIDASALRDASSLYALRKDAPPDGFALALRARRDVAPVIDALWSQGYYDAAVAIRVDGIELGAGDFTAFQRAAESHRGVSPVPVEIAVKPGPQFALRRLSLQDPEGRPLDVPERVVRLRPGDPAAADAVRGLQARLVDFYRARSRPLARVVKLAPVVDHPARAMDLMLVVDPGREAALGEIGLTGPKSFNPLVARSFIYLKPGDPYDPAALADAKADLRQIPAVGAVRIKEAEKLDAQGRLPLTIDVGDRAGHAVGIAAQYSTVDGPAIQTYWEDRNLFGGAEFLRLEANLSYAPAAAGAAQTIFGLSDRDIGGRLAAHFLKPAFDGGRDDFLADASAERATTTTRGFKGYTVNDVEIDAAVRHRFARDLSAQGGLDAQAGAATDALRTVNYRLFGAFGQVDYDSTDDRLDPKRGWRLKANAAGYIGTLSLDAFRTEASYYQSLDAEGRFVLAERTKLAAEIGPDLGAIPANLRLYAGGGGSVRGYAYASLGPRTPSGAVLGGRSAFEASGEFRWRATESFGAVVFFDAGNAFLARWPNFSAPLQMSAGLGLRYYTGFGPLRLDVAFPLNPRSGDPRFAVYAGIGQSF